MNKRYSGFTPTQTRLVLLSLFAAVNLCLSLPVLAQDGISQGETSTPQASGSNTSIGSPYNGESQPAASDSDQQLVRQASPSTTTDQMPQIRTSNQTAVDAGLVPVFNSGISTSATASGLVSGFPGLTSLGGQAASAASTAKQPLSVYANQTLAYTDNPGQLTSSNQIGGQLGTVANTAHNGPDEYEVTSFGGLYSRKLGQQEFFASGNFTITNYFHDTNFNSTQYSLSVGDNYALADVCAGTLVANQSQSAVPVQFLQASLSAQTSENSSLEASARCRVTGHFAVLSDLRLTKTSFSDPTSSANDSKQVFGSGSVEYSVPQFIVIGILASIQESEFARGSLIQTVGLSNETSQLNFSAYLTKPLTAKINVSLSAGIADLSTGGPTLAGAIQPVYTATVSYTYSPKTSFNAAITHSVGSPQNLLANFQQIDSISFGASYRYSSKTSISVGVGQSKTSGSSAGIGSISAAPISAVGLNSANLFEQISIGYRVGQRLSTSLSYQHLSTRQDGFAQTANTNIVSLSFNYSR